MGGQRQGMSRILVTKLMRQNRSASARYLSPDEYAKRKRYRDTYRSAKKASKCSDERIALSEITMTPQGIIEPFRTIGGRFSLGMPYYQKLVAEWVQRNYFGNDHLACIAFLTYHWDETDEHLGCRGFHYDVEAARDHIRKLRGQYIRDFGLEQVQPIMLGIETHSQRLIFHGSHDEIFDLRDAVGMSDGALFKKISDLYPGIKDQVAHDLVPIMTGNTQYFQSLGHSERSHLDFRHSGNILAVGRGFDWLDKGQAMIVGPFDLDMAKQIETASDVIWQNWKDDVIEAEDGIVLLASAVYWHQSTEYYLACDKAVELAQFTHHIVSNHSKKEVREMASMWEPLVGVVDMNSRKLKRLECQLVA